MNNRQVLELAGWLAEHGVAVVGRCRGITAGALRNYLAARQQQFQAWSDVLHVRPDAEKFTPADAAPKRGRDVLTATREIAVHGVLVRVASTILYSIGERLDIPLALDVANQTARSFGKVQTATATVALHTEVPASELSGLDRLGRLCDRLSDLFCGTLLPALQCDRFVVDRERAADFAQTFGQQPSLARLPLRTAFRVISAAAPNRSESADDVERSLRECFPVLNDRSARPDELTDLRETFGPTIYPFPARNAGVRPRATTEPARPLAFPTLSFAELVRKSRGLGED